MLCAMSRQLYRVEAQRLWVVHNELTAKSQAEG